jgi:hypothetical protein
VHTCSPLVIGISFLFTRMRLWTLLLFFSVPAFAVRRSDCTKYVSPTGGGTKCTLSVPCSISTANSQAVAGDRVCLKGGNYEFARGFHPLTSGNGDRSTWPPSLSEPAASCPNCIVWEDYGDAPVWFLNASNYVPLGGNWLVNINAGTACCNGLHYLMFIGLNLDGKAPNGQYGANNGFFGRYLHHIAFVDNYIRNTTGAGIAYVNADYVFTAKNTVWHNGENNTIPSNATSGISYNGTCFYDNYTGFHNYVISNMVSGQQDDQANTDGNAYISDLSCSRVHHINQANTPPELIANNVFFMNSGNCVMLFTVTNNYAVNNTCYKNDLNTNLLAGHIGEMGENTSRGNYYINNLVYTWNWRSSAAYFKDNGIKTSTWTHNLWYGTGPNFSVPGPAYADRDPLFVNAPTVNSYPYAKEWQKAPDPRNVAEVFRLQVDSPGLATGIDPSTLPGLDPHIVIDMRRFIYSDLAGHSRRVGGPFDLGAYQH